MAQKFAVAAGNHGEAVLDEVDGAVSQRRGLPWISGDARRPVDDICDLAVARAVHAAVDGLQHVAQPSASLSRQARVGEGRAVVERTPEPRDGVDAIEAVGVERNQGRQRLIGPSIAKHQKADGGGTLAMDNAQSLRAELRATGIEVKWRNALQAR